MLYSKKRKTFSLISSYADDWRSRTMRAWAAKRNVTIIIITLPIVATMTMAQWNTRIYVLRNVVRFSVVVSHSPRRHVDDHVRSVLGAEEREKKTENNVSKHRPADRLETRWWRADDIEWISSRGCRVKGRGEEE